LERSEQLWLETCARRSLMSFHFTFFLYTVAMSELIKAYYEELKGMREAIPVAGWFDDDGISEKYHQTLNKLSKVISNFEINEYKVQPRHLAQRGMIIDTNQYKTNINSIIGHLKGRFDFDNNQSASGHTFIQNQSVSIELVLNLQEKIINLEREYEEGTPEKTFLQKLKKSLSSIKDATDVVGTVLSEAQKAGVTLEKLTSMFVN
jgi:hypothetical protein